MYTDLHIHTTRSDGTFTPRTLIAELVRQKVSVFSVTDHNRMPQTKLLERMAKAANLTYLPGCEVDCLHGGFDIHVLLYGFSPTARLTRLVRSAREQLLLMSVDLVQRLAKEDDRVSLADYAAFEDNPALGGWKGIRYLVARGLAPDFPAAMALYGQYGIDYEKYPFPSVQKICEAVHQAGGVAVLAHPGAVYLGKLPPQKRTQALDELITLGVDGIECYHPRNDQELTAFLNDYCSNRQLLRTAGSDCHGNFHRVYKGISFQVGHPAVLPGQLKLPLDAAKPTP